MPTLIEQIASAQERMKQLKHRKKAEEKRKHEHKCKVDMRRNIIIGEIFSKHFPDVLIFTPRRTTVNNNVEFAPLDDFLSTLATDEDWGILLKTEVSRKALSENQHTGSITIT